MRMANVGFAVLKLILQVHFAQLTTVVQGFAAGRRVQQGRQFLRFAVVVLRLTLWKNIAIT